MVASHTHSPPRLARWSLTTGTKISLLSLGVLENAHHKQWYIAMYIDFTCSKPLSDLEVFVREMKMLSEVSVVIQ